MLPITVKGGGHTPITTNLRFRSFFALLLASNHQTALSGDWNLICCALRTFTCARNPRRRLLQGTLKARPWRLTACLHSRVNAPSCRPGVKTCLDSRLNAPSCRLPPLDALLDARTAPMGLAMAVYHRNKMKPATRASLSQTGASGGFILLGR